MNARRRLLALAAATVAAPPRALAHPANRVARIALILNARTVRAPGIALPKPALLVADEVIE